MAKPSDSRERFLDAGAALFRRQGYEATALKDIVRVGEAPWGSLYHFFPGGKEELCALSIQRSGERFRHLIELVFQRNDDPAVALQEMFELSAKALAASGFADGCPIVTVALESANASEPLRQRCKEAFDSWLETLEQVLVSAQIDAATARRIAVLGLSSFEGAIALSRTLRSTEPLVTSAGILTDLVESVQGSTAGRESA